jgi:hypothetical protein
LNATIRFSSVCHSVPSQVTVPFVSALAAATSPLLSCLFVGGCTSISDSIFAVLLKEWERLDLIDLSGAGMRAVFVAVFAIGELLPIHIVCIRFANVLFFVLISNTHICMLQVSPPCHTPRCFDFARQREKRRYIMG